MIDLNSTKHPSFNRDAAFDHIEGRRSEFGFGAGVRYITEAEEEAPRPRPSRNAGPVLPPLIASLDIGGAKDPSVLLVLRTVPPDASIQPNDPAFAPTYVLERAAPAPLGVLYEETAALFAKYMNQPAMAGAMGVVDRTGLGRPVFEMIAKQVKSLVAISFTSAGDGVRGGRFWRVPKLDAVAALQLALPRVQVPALAQGASYVKAQLQDFGETRSKTGHSRFGNASSGGHDDAVTGLMLAILVGDWLWKKQAGLINTRPSGANRPSGGPRPYRR